MQRRYIITERLGILVGAAAPDIGALALAIGEADDWEDDYMDSI